MNALGIIIELVELTVLIVLLVYLIRLIRDNMVAGNKTSKSDMIDRNLAELAGFHRLMVKDPDIARIWLEGRADRGFHDLDQERFSLLANEYLTILANQKERADTFDDPSLAETATQRLIRDLKLNPGLLAVWDSIADDVAPSGLKSTVADAMTVTNAVAVSENESIHEPQEATASTEVVITEESAAPEVVVTEESATPEVSDNELVVANFNGGDESSELRVGDSRAEETAAKVA